MTESSHRSGRKGKAIVPPGTDVSPRNIDDLEFLFSKDENTQQDVETQLTHQQSQGTQVDWAVKMRIRREHCDVLSMQIYSDLVIYRTTLVRAFQVVTICRVDKSESTRSVLGKCVYLVTLAMSLFDLRDVCIAIRSIATLDLPMVVDLIGIYGLKGPYYTLTTTNWFLQALSVIPSRRRRLHAPPPPLLRRKIVSGQFDEENPSAQISSGLLVQADEGLSNPVVDLIGVNYRNLP
ncbi:Potassium transporter [Dorcoceras hygrometricum]|uniref:Potassium transporter n=1 Tax=Dorcoceras hygrometricum TaxID=472368 RepID=A0A2Z7BMS2_9LAMI|nr:Potassium transporter [Dorcoceras hygrometricum]